MLSSFNKMFWPVRALLKQSINAGSTQLMWWLRSARWKMDDPCLDLSNLADNLYLMMMNPVLPLNGNGACWRMIPRWLYAKQRSPYRSRIRRSVPWSVFFVLESQSPAKGADSKAHDTQFTHRHFLRKHINPPWPARGVECNVCDMELLEWKAEVLNHAECYHRTVVWGRAQGRLAAECQQHARLVS